MFIFKKLFFLIIFILINGCTLNNFEKKQNINNFSIEINTHLMINITYILKKI